jgi:hypothetical protein
MGRSVVSSITSPTVGETQVVGAHQAGYEDALPHSPTVGETWLWCDMNHPSYCNNKDRSNLRWCGGDMSYRPLRPNSIWLVRGTLTADLMILRSRMTMMGFLPLCAVCGLPVRYPMVIAVLVPDTHGGTEVDDNRMACWVKENCVLIHPNECYKIALTRAGRLVCTRSLIKAEGVERILAWLEEMDALRGRKHEEARELLAKAATFSVRPSTRSRWGRRST